MIEYRRAIEPFTVTDVGTRGDDGGVTVSGYASVFSSEAELMPGLFEAVAPGAFAEALRSRPSTPLLMNHNPNVLLARSPRTMSIREDSHGLKITAKLPDNHVGQYVGDAIGRRDLVAMSFAMSGVTDKWEPRGATGALRTILSVERLHDVSAVVSPAYEDTSIGVIDGGRSRLSDERWSYQPGWLGDRFRSDQQRELQAMRRRVARPSYAERL